MNALKTSACLVLLAAGSTSGRHLTETAVEALQHPNTNPVDVTQPNIEAGSLPSSVDLASVGSNEPDKTFSAQQNGGGLDPDCTDDSPCKLTVTAGEQVQPLSTTTPSVDLNAAGNAGSYGANAGTDGISASGRRLMQEVTVPTNTALELKGDPGTTTVPGETVSDQEAGQGNLNNLNDEHIRSHGVTGTTTGIIDGSNGAAVNPSGFDALDNSPVVTAGGT